MGIDDAEGLHGLVDGGTRRDSTVNYAENPFSIRTGEAKTRESDPFPAQPNLLDGQLDVLHELRSNIEVKQGSEPTVKLPRLDPFPRRCELPQTLILSR